MRVDLIDRLMQASGLCIRFFVYCTLMLPAVIVVAASLTADNTMAFPPAGLSWRWYSAAVDSPQFMGALWASVRLASVATCLSMLLGFCSAFAINRYRFPGRNQFQTLALSPLVVPMVVLGLGLLQFFAWIGLNQSYVGLLIGHTLIMLPYVVRTLGTGLALLDRTLEEAAQNLRARPLTVIRKVTLPLMLPSLISAAVFAFVTSFGNVTLSVFLGMTGTVTLPVQIFTYVESSYDPILAAVSGIVIAVTLLIILAIERLVGVSRIV